MALGRLPAVARQRAPHTVDQPDPEEKAPRILYDAAHLPGGDADPQGNRLFDLYAAHEGNLRVELHRLSVRAARQALATERRLALI